MKRIPAPPWWVGFLLGTVGMLLGTVVVNRRAWDGLLRVLVQLGFVSLVVSAFVCIWVGVVFLSQSRGKQ